MKHLVKTIGLMVLGAGVCIYTPIGGPLSDPLYWAYAICAAVIVNALFYLAYG